MTIAPGGRLGPYEIVSRIGAGGMGEVWKARDTRIDRIVAIKTSHDSFTDRFAQEVRAIAALNHPHICTLYDVGPDYLVMEYVEGSEIKGPLPLDQTLRYAIQLASALEAAHRKGITHRDLKPANILVTKNSIKVLDFGLAKFELVKAGAADEAMTRAALTQEGSIVGTLQYMAPEQLQGKVTDARADFFSFGCVLFEMLTGKRAFDGSNTASLIVAIMEREPPSMGAVAPASLDWLVRRCLAKDQDERWQSARDLRAALERVEVIAIEAHAAKPSRLPLLGWGVAGVLAIVAGAALFAHYREASPETAVTRFTIEAPPATTVDDRDSFQAISPDGRSVLFQARSADGVSWLWLRRLESLEVHPIAGTEGATFPFWSPDNRTFGFFSAGKLRKVEIGGPVTTLADAPYPRGGTWSQDGVIVFAPSATGGLASVSASGGAVHTVTTADSKSPFRRFPWFLPDGRHFLYQSSEQGRNSIRVGSLDSQTDDRLLSDNADSFALFSQGNLLFLRGNTLVARPFDAKKLAFAGEAVPVAEQVMHAASFGDGQFSVSTNGTLIYRSGLETPGQLTWMDRAGKVAGTVGEAGTFGTIQLSPDGKTVAAVMHGADINRDIWLYDVLHGLPTRFTFYRGVNQFPVWSPDGRTIFFRSLRTGGGDLYRKATDGSQDEVLLYGDNAQKLPTSASPDGKYLAYWVSSDGKSGNSIWILPDPLAAPGTAKPYPFLRTEFNEMAAQFSPDGHWMAYQSDETGKYDVYVTPFPGPGGKRQVSRGGGQAPRWRADGREIFFISTHGLMGAEVTAKGDIFEVGNTVRLAERTGTPGELSWGGSLGYGISADGQKFLSVQRPDVASAPLTVDQNWMAGLKK